MFEGGSMIVVEVSLSLMEKVTEDWMGRRGED